MKKRLCSILLFAAMLVTLLPVCSAAGTVPQYSDVPETHWAYSAVQVCSQRTWFGGYPDGTFGPERLIRRDEAAKVFAQALGLAVEENPTLSFTDTADNWARGYIEATKALFPDATNLQGTLSFRPEQTITREETVYALVVAWRYASRTINADQSVLDMFSDAYSISAGVKPYVAVAVQEGLVAGLPDGTIGAQKGLTRAEFATLLARALNHGYGPDKTETPVITLDHYPAVTAAETVTLSGRVSPVTPGLRLTVNGASLTLTDTGAFQTPVPLAQGTNIFTLTAETLYGLQTTQTLTIERRADTVGIRFLTPIPAETQADRCTVRGQIENYAPDCVLLLDNTMVKTDAQGQFETELVLQQGKNIFRFTVIRQSQEVAVQEVTIIRKAAAPTVVSTELGVVTSKTATTVTISGIGTLTFAGHEIYSDISKDDVVVSTLIRPSTPDNAKTYYRIERAETVTGTLTAYQNRGGVTIGSSSYSFYRSALYTDSLTNAVSTFTSDHIGETFTLYLVDGYVGAAVLDSVLATNYSVVLETSDTQIQVMGADGTKTSVTVSTSSPTKDFNIGDIVVYDMKNGEAHVKALATPRIASRNSEGYRKDTKTFNGVTTSSDCALFVSTEPGNGSIKVYNIRDLGDIPVAGKTMAVVEKNGQIVAAYVDLGYRPSSFTSQRFYGIVSSYDGIRKVDGEAYKQYTVENQNECYTVLLNINSTKISGAGALVSFEVTNDNIYVDKDITVYDGTVFDNTHGLATWVKEYNASDRVIAHYDEVNYTDSNYYAGSYSSAYAVDENCTLVYVNMEDQEAGINIGIPQFDTVTGYRNVLLVKNESTDQVTAIFVETSGECDILPAR